MAQDTYLTRLEYKGKILNFLGKLYILKGNNRDFLVFARNEAHGGGEFADIQVVNENLKILCKWSEAQEELSKRGRYLYKNLFKRPARVIRWLSQDQCMIK